MVTQSQNSYLWNWILSCCWCFISPKIRQGPTFCYSFHPKAFIKLAFVRIVELSSAILLAISPGTFIPVSICLNKNWKVCFPKSPFPLSPLTLYIFGKMYEKQIVYTKLNDALSMILILQPLSLKDISILIVHSSPATPTVLTPFPLVN